VDPGLRRRELVRVVALALREGERRPEQAVAGVGNFLNRSVGALVSERLERPLQLKRSAGSLADPERAPCSCNAVRVNT
jgi:hypothetical protein